MKNSNFIFFYSPNISKNDHYLEFPNTGLDAWINQTFSKLSLIQNGFELKMTNNIPEEGIIIFHSGHFPKNIRPNSKQLFICISADYGRSRFAQIHLFQNFEQINRPSIRSMTDSVFTFTHIDFLPHWPQPKIRKRLSSREPKIKRIGYFGRKENLSKDIFDFLKDLCKKRGWEFVVVDNYLDWANYSEFDLCIAIRDFSKKDYTYKPFSKVLNSVLAGVPVISSKESSNCYFKYKYYKNLPIVSDLKELERVIFFIDKNYSSVIIDVEKSCVNLELNYEKDLLEKWANLLNNTMAYQDVWVNTTSMIRHLFFLSRSISF